MYNPLISFILFYQSGEPSAGFDPVVDLFVERVARLAISSGAIFDDKSVYGIVDRIIN